MNLLRCKPASHIFIAIPTYIGSLRFDTALSIIETSLALRAAGISVSLRAFEGNCYIDYSRNELVGDFLETDATDMLFWDDDVGVETETVLKICRANRPVVAAIYPKKADEEAYPVDFLPGWHDMDSDGVIEVGMVPTGMMRINRVVFEAMKPTVDWYKGRIRDVHDYFACVRRDHRYLGEDIEFCKRWRALGGKLYVFPNENLSHTGPKAWIGNLGEAMRGGKLK